MTDSNMTNKMIPTDFTEIIELEKRMLDSSIRKNLVEAGKLLNDDFVEFGTSGRTYDKKAILELLSEETSTVVEAFDFIPVQLSVNVVQLRFKTRRKSKDGSITVSLRSSLWKRVGKDWQMIFHQGTKTNP